MENEIKELIEAIKPLITPQGLKMSGMGIFVNNAEKGNEIADKSQKFLYFMETRQKRMEEQNIEIINILKAIAAKLK